MERGIFVERAMNSRLIIIGGTPMKLPHHRSFLHLAAGAAALGGCRLPLRRSTPGRARRSSRLPCWSLGPPLIPPKPDFGDVERDGRVAPFALTQGAHLRQERFDPRRNASQ